MPAPDVKPPQLHWPEGLDPQRFLREYWQKRPLLLKNALPGFRPPLSPDELAGLACEPDADARLVLEHGSTPWELRQGPFDEAAFQDLPASHWTLLVQDVEKHAPPLATLLQAFRFIPDWRVDDLMASYAVDGGSVGPHVDDYDVFLVQGLGRRHWYIEDRPRRLDDYRPDLDLRILNHFAPDRDWVLEPGDILYLPPRIAHHGVALGDDCMTWSVGYRAPGYHDMVAGFLEFLLEEVDRDARYTDPDLLLQDNPGAITPAALEKIKTVLRQHILLDDEIIESWFGRFITEPKAAFVAAPEPEPYSESELRRHLKEGGVLERNPGSRFAYVDPNQGETALFIDGQEFVLGPDIAWLAPLLCRHRTLGQADLGRALKQPDARALLLDLVNEGYLVIYEDD